MTRGPRSQDNRLKGGQWVHGGFLRLWLRLRHQGLETCLHASATCLQPVESSVAFLFCASCAGAAGSHQLKLNGKMNSKAHMNNPLYGPTFGAGPPPAASCQLSGCQPAPATTSLASEHTGTRAHARTHTQPAVSSRQPPPSGLSCCTAACVQHVQPNVRGQVVTSSCGRVLCCAVLVRIRFGTCVVRQRPLHQQQARVQLRARSNSVTAATCSPNRTGVRCLVSFAPPNPRPVDPSWVRPGKRNRPNRHPPRLTSKGTVRSFPWRHQV